MQKRYFIGIDVSKHTLDVAFIIHESLSFTKPVWKQFENTNAGLKLMHKWLNELRVPLSSQTIVVIENTGIYHRLLWHFFSSLHVDLCIESKPAFANLLLVARAFQQYF